MRVLPSRRNGARTHAGTHDRYTRVVVSFIKSCVLRGNACARALTTGTDPLLLSCVPIWPREKTLIRASGTNAPCWLPLAAPKDIPSVAIKIWYAKLRRIVRFCILSFLSLTVLRDHCYRYRSIIFLHIYIVYIFFHNWICYKKLNSLVFSCSPPQEKNFKKYNFPFSIYPIV